jgi:hypothetical protein
MKLKKLFCLFLILIFLSVPVFAFADAPYTINFLPELYEAEESPEWFIDFCMPVSLGWETVFKDETIHAYIFLPYNTEQLISIVLSDGFHLVHGKIENIADDFVYVEFPTVTIRNFTNKGAYLLFICRTE